MSYRSVRFQRPARPAGKISWQAELCECRDIAEVKNRKRAAPSNTLIGSANFLSCPQPKVPLMGTAKDKSGPLARRPDNSAFKQQRLPAWSPMLTANTVLPFFYFMALICMLLGVWLLLTVQTIQEIKVRVCF